MSGQYIRRIAGLVVLLLSLALLAWGLQPTRLEMRTLMIPPGELGTRRMVLEWPALLRRQDSGFIRLTLTSEQVDAAYSPPAPKQTQFMSYARVEIEGVAYTPVGEVAQALLPGRAVQFTWSVRAAQAGDFDGAIWIHSQPVSVESDQSARRVIAAPKIEIQTRDVFGLGGPWARALGSASAVIGAVFSMDGLLLSLWRRLGRKPLLSSLPNEIQRSKKSRKRYDTDEIS